MAARKLIALALVSAVFATACDSGSRASGPDTQALQDSIAALSKRLDEVSAASNFLALKSQVDSLSQWLRKDTPPAAKPTISVHDWHLGVADAICQLEDRVKKLIAAVPGVPALIDGERLCHDGGDHGTPPKPPPWL